MDQLTLIIITGVAVGGYGVGYFLYSRYRWRKADIPGIVAVYPAERNASIESPGGLEQLMELTRKVVRLLGASTPVAVG